jgi:hypothetical protein
VDSGEWPSSLPPGLERDALDRARQAYAERPARDVLEVLAGPHEDRLVLLGDPGVVLWQTAGSQPGTAEFLRERRRGPGAPVRAPR